jgi:hypothetical protein
MKGFGRVTRGERDDLDDLSVDGRIILIWIFKTWDGGHGLDLSDSEEEHVACSGECGSEPLVSIKCGEILD